MRKARCPLCSTEVPVTAEEKFKAHTPKGQRCNRSGQPVRAGDVIAAPVFFQAPRTIIQRGDYTIEVDNQGRYQHLATKEWIKQEQAKIARTQQPTDGTEYPVGSHRSVMAVNGGLPTLGRRR